MNRDDYYMAGIDAFAEGRFEDAIAAYEKALAQDPNFTDPLHGLAQVYAQQGRLDEAIVVAQRIAALDPNDVMAHTTLSVFYQRKGMIAEAEAEAAKARVLSWKDQLKEQQQS